MIVPISDCATPVASASSAFPWPTAIPAFISAMVAVIVGYVAWQQWRTAREKLRLDLYNRRFEIYVNTLEFVKAVTDWRGTEEQGSIASAFHHSLRESQFLFSAKSKIHGQLKELYDSGLGIIARSTETNIYGITYNDNRSNVSHDVLRTRDWTELLSKLETLLAPYLSFPNIN